MRSDPWANSRSDNRCGGAKIRGCCTGRGRFYDDLKLADQLHAAIVRSPHAHADINGIDARAALQMPGVHAVLTGEDYRSDGLGTLPSMAPYKQRDGRRDGTCRSGRRSPSAA